MYLLEFETKSPYLWAQVVLVMAQEPVLVQQPEVQLRANVPQFML